MIAHRRARPLRSLGSLAAALLLAVATPLLAEAAREPRPILAGQPLTEALAELAARGLPLVFSSRVVLPAMTVAATPAGETARAILDELLAPYGLVAVAGAGGSLVIGAAHAEAIEPAAISGVVRSRQADLPLAGVVVGVGESGVETVTAADGAFRIDGLRPGVYELELRRPGFVIETVAGVVALAGETTELAPWLTPAPFAGDEIVVHPSRAAILRDEPASVVNLGREEILSLPHLGNDVLRALEILPGVASNDVTAQFHVRGGRRDEVLVLLDGQELYEAFHLHDFDNALSLVAASNLTGVHLSTGAFAADYGDRMGGVLELSTAPPPEPGRYRLAASLLAVELGASRPLAGGEGGWLVHGRHGTGELAREILDREQPEYWDVFGRLDRRFGERQSARLNLLTAGDRYDLVEPGDEEAKTVDTDYDVAYLWLTHQAIVGERIFVDSALSWSRGDRDRRAVERDAEKAIDVLDRRESRVVSLQQTWNAQLGSDHHLKLGGLARRFTSDFDYFAAREFDTPLALVRTATSDPVTALDRSFADDHVGFFLSDRWRIGASLTVELGVRYDEHSLVSDSVTSPRAHLAWSLRPGHLLRLAWGRYAQGQRPYELAVEDGELAFHRRERSEQWVAGYEKRFERPARVGPTALRVELYRRAVDHPRPRYENLFEPFDAFPEGETDRFRFAPERSRAAGVELFVRAELGERVQGWLDYAYARSEDSIDGAWVPRLIDQRHTVNFDLHLELVRGWSLDLAGLFHTGRPTTSIALAEIEDDEGESELVPVLGPLNGERLDDYLRFDLRLARAFAVRGGRLALYLDAQNLLGRENDAGFSVELDEDEEALVFDRERWPGFVASAGFAWEF